MSEEIVKDIKTPRPVSWDKVAEQAAVLYPEIFIGEDTIELTSLIEQVRQITNSPIIIDSVKIFLCAVTAFQLRQYIKKVDDRDALIKELADALEKVDGICDGDMCKFFAETKHCTKCKYLDVCSTGVAHSVLKKHESEIAKVRGLVNG